jgi:hypothetical protein
MKDSELNDNITFQTFVPFLSMIVTLFQRVCKKT